VKAVAIATVGQTERLKEAAMKNHEAQERSRFLRHLVKFRETVSKLNNEKKLSAKLKMKAQMIAAVVPLYLRANVHNLPSFRIVSKVEDTDKCRKSRDGNSAGCLFDSKICVLWIIFKLKKIEKLTVGVLGRNRSVR
jgi:hypothetical protein